MKISVHMQNMIGTISREFRLETWRLVDLPVVDQQVLEAAHVACTGAYAPHSAFHVGAAVRLASGVIVVGSNQENMAYPSGLCAERVAFFAAGAQFPGESIVSAAVVTNTHMDVHHFSPCGGCRQVMLESELRQATPIRFLMQTAGSDVLVSHDIRQFLPLTFQLPS